MQTRNIGIILLIGLLIMASIVTTPPYDSFQFIDQTTNANTTSFFNGDYDGKLLYADWNKIGFIDINDLNIGSAVDGNIVMTSPDGTQWNCGVSNLGNLECS